MHRLIVRVLVFCLAVVATTVPVAAQSTPKVKVACVGDSITAGSGVKEPEKKYPFQLGRLLGADYEVKNFGVGDSTATPRYGPFP